MFSLYTFFPPQTKLEKSPYSIEGIDCWGKSCLWFGIINEVEVHSRNCELSVFAALGPGGRKLNTQLLLSVWIRVGCGKACYCSQCWSLFMIPRALHLDIYTDSVDVTLSCSMVSWKYWCDLYVGHLTGNQSFLFHLFWQHAARLARRCLFLCRSSLTSSGIHQQSQLIIQGKVVTCQWNYL